MFARVPDSVRAPFEIPTDKPEADGTIALNSTTLLLVEISGGGETGVVTPIPRLRSSS